MSFRIGIIGAGQIGEDHAKRLTKTLTDAEVVAVASRRMSSAERVAVICGARAMCDSTALIRAKEVDAVVITSPSELHAEQVLQCIEAGKPVFCEKPLAISAADCRKIVVAETAAGKRLVQVGFMRRYDSGYRRLKAAMDGRAFGQPLMVHCAHRNIAPHGVFTTEMSITQTAIHEIDVTRWLLEDDYVSAQVLFPRQTANTEQDRLRDPQILLLRTKKGICIQLEVYVNCGFGYDIQCEVVCENGVLRLPDPTKLWIRAEAKRYMELETDWVLRFIDSYDVELREWLEDLKNGCLRGPSAWDGYAAAVTADALIAAQKSGKVESIVMDERPSIYE